MENAADALQMAAAVLIFVLALTIAINSFGQARQTAQLILDYNDREYDYTYVEQNVDEHGNLVTKRLVSLESIIPTIYKAYRENYRIVFDNLEKTGCFLYKKRQDNKNLPNYGDFVEVYEIDMEQGGTLANEERKLQFIMRILYGNDYKDWDDKMENYFSPSFQFGNLSDGGLYGIIKKNNWVFEESIGVYYQEQAKGEDGTGGTAGENVPEANLTEKRVITYKIIN